MRVLLLSVCFLLLLGFLLFFVFWGGVVYSTNQDGQYFSVSSFATRKFKWRNPECDSSLSNPRDNSFVKCIDKNDLNDSSLTFLRSRNSSYSNLDLFSTYPSIRLNYNWHVLKYIHGSDHFPFYYHLRNRPHCGSSTQLTGHDSKFFVSNIFPINDNSVEAFSTTLVEIAHLSISPTSGNHNVRQEPGFNGHCKEAVKQRKHDLRRFQQPPTSENLVIHQRNHALARRPLMFLHWRSTMNLKPYGSSHEVS